MNKINPLQMGRGIAALMVVLYHAHVLMSEKYQYDFMDGIFSYGFTGVDFFFVLSGFIIYYVHHKDIGKPQSLNRFLVRRFTRIFPLYWLVTILVLPVYFLVPSFGDGTQTRISSIVQSFLLFPQEHRPIVAVGWTLSHELLFYVLFALSIVMARKWYKYLLAGWVTLTIFFSFVPAGNFYGDFLFSPYNFEFLAGCLAAYLIVQMKPAFNNVIFYFSGAVLFVLSCLNYTHPVILPNQILFAASCFLLVLALANTKTKISKPFVYLGNASYSIYLVHYLLLSLLFKAFSKFRIFESAGMFVGQTMMIMCVVILSCLFYSIVEKRFVAKANRAIVNQLETDSNLRYTWHRVMLSVFKRRLWWRRGGYENHHFAYHHRQIKALRQNK